MTIIQESLDQLMAAEEAAFEAPGSAESRTAVRRAEVAFGLQVEMLQKSGLYGFAVTALDNESASILTLIQARLEDKKANAIGTRRLPVQILSNATDAVMHAVAYRDAVIAARSFVKSWSPEEFATILDVWARDRLEGWEFLRDAYKAALQLVSASASVEQISTEIAVQAVSMMFEAAHVMVDKTRIELQEAVAMHMDALSEAQRTYMSAKVNMCYRLFPRTQSSVVAPIRMYIPADEWAPKIETDGIDYWRIAVKGFFDGIEPRVEEKERQEKS